MIDPQDFKKLQDKVASLEKILFKSSRNLQNTEERLSKILEEHPDAVICTNKDGIISFWNLSAKEMFGRKFSEVFKKRVADVFREVFDEDFSISPFNLRPKDIEINHETYFDIEVKLPGENVRYCQVSCSFSDIELERIYTFIIRDVTDTVTKQKELVKLNIELEQFAYFTSHDMQEPLRAVSLNLDEIEYLVSDNAKLEEIKPFTESCFNQIERLKNTIEDLLQFAKSKNVDESTFTKFNANDVIDEVTEVLAQSINELNASIKSADLPTLRGQKSFIYLVFFNLIGNGIKYQSANNNPEVKIDYKEHREVYEFIIKDNGIGIDAKYFETIFHPLKRLHRQSEYRGTGLGLPICKRIIESHGGKVWLESTPGEGSSFHFTIKK